MFEVRWLRITCGAPLRVPKETVVIALEGELQGPVDFLRLGQFLRFLGCQCAHLQSPFAGEQAAFARGGGRGLIAIMPGRDRKVGARNECVLTSHESRCRERN